MLPICMTVIDANIQFVEDYSYGLDQTAENQPKIDGCAWYIKEAEMVQKLERLRLLTLHS